MTTFYVRPADGGANGDGSSPAQSWNGFVNIVWASVAQNTLTGQGLDFGANELVIPVAANGIAGTKTVIQDIIVDGVATDCYDLQPHLEYIRLLRCTALNAGNVGFELANGQAASDYVGLEFIDCVASNGGSGIRWVSNNANLSTMTDLLIEGCTLDGNAFDGLSLMMFSNTNANTAMTDIVIRNNSANSNVSVPGQSGHGFRVRADSNAGAQRSGANLQFFENIATGNGSSDGVGGGGVSIGGFDVADIAHNTSSSNNGAIGGINVYLLQNTDIRDNVCNDNDGAGADANGILADHGNDDVRVFRNECSRNINGTGQNTGYAIMVLSGNNNAVWANYGDGNNRGMLFAGATGADTSNVTVFNNVFTGSLTAGYRVSSSWQSNSVLNLQNNVFTGAGPFAVLDQSASIWQESFNQTFGFDAYAESGRALGTGSTFGVDPELAANGYTQYSGPGYNAGSVALGNPADNDLRGDQNKLPFRAPIDIGLQSNILATPIIVVSLVVASVALTADDSVSSPDLTEKQIRLGADFWRLVLTNATWVDPLTTQMKQDIINGLVDTSSAANDVEWGKVRATLTPGRITRLISGTEVRIDFAQTIDYNILAPGSIQSSVPSSATSDPADLIAVPEAVIAPTPLEAGQADLVGDAILTAVGVRKKITAADLVGDATLTADVISKKTGQANLVGDATLTGALIDIATSNASLVGDATLTATGLRKRIGSAFLVGDAILTAAAITGKSGQAVLSGDAILTANGRRIGTVPGVASLVGSATLEATAQVLSGGWIEQNPVDSVWVEQ